ncbi:C45 family autoproteolytic acyltransferase/hydrolase [Pseudalkalibacillus sp. R45]|uniref:C45 family autoproteolytic acyltransferase/hydolase n=1 Tax=Pseudalkalibacillus sp. R45 TaxID=3457433 RepID=UPI003FCCED7D
MIKHLTLKGTPMEIGRNHGEKGREQVLQSLSTYEALFHGYSKISWKQAKEMALSHLHAIEQYNPDFIEEMEGVAQGAGVEFEDILALNARSEIALATYSGKTRSFSDGCTAIGITPPLSNNAILSQNWDWKAAQIKSLLLLDIEQEGKPSIQMVTEGGIIGKIGYNSAGMGVCLNALLTNRKSEQVPIHLGLRSVLNSSSLHEAVSKIKDGQMASTANFMIGSDQGDGRAMVANYEVSPYGIDMMTTNEGKVVHTNHILSDKILENVEDRNEFKFDDSLIRKNRAEQLIHSKVHLNQTIDTETFKIWLSDEFNKPNSINHYENERAPEHRRMETVFSIIMNLSNHSMELCVGKADPNEYTYYNLSNKGVIKS